MSNTFLKLRFILVAGILCFACIHNTYPQSSFLKYHNNNQKGKIYCLGNSTDTTYEKLLSVTVGAAPYKIANNYFLNIDYVTHLSQRIYLIIGFVGKYRKFEDYDYYASVSEYFGISLFLEHKWSLNKKLNLFIGAGFNFTVIMPGAILPYLDSRLDYKISSWLYSGINIRQRIYLDKYMSRYEKYPWVGFSLALVL